MTPLVLAAAGPLIRLWAQADPATDLIRSGYAQLGFLALLLAGGWWVIRESNKRAASAEKGWKELLAEANARTAEEKQRREAAEEDSRAVRDAFIREIVPATTLQTVRSEELLKGLQQVVKLVEKVMETAIERPK